MTSKQSDYNDQLHSMSVQQPSSSSGGYSPVPKGLTRCDVDSSVFEDLIKFFKAKSADMVIDVEIWIRKLRDELLTSAKEAVARGKDGGDALWVNGGVKPYLDPHRKYGDPADMPPEEEAPIEVSRYGFTPEEAPPLEMMPSLGRHPPVRKDMESPTLLKVLEVYQKRDELDAKLVRERTEALSRQTALNEIQAQKQQEEGSLEKNQELELHKVKCFEALQRKQMMDETYRQSTEANGMQKIHRIIAANDRADRSIEQKRSTAEECLQTWHEGVERAKQYTRKTEWEKRKEGERSHERYLKRLVQVGESRMHVAKTKEERADELKGTVHMSLAQQLKEAAMDECAGKAEAYNTKLANAAERRHCMQLGSRYRFVEKTFGANAVGFDAKSHSVAINRQKNGTWRTQHDEWKKVKNSFSAPELPTARPLSPGGVINETSFMSLSKSVSHPGSTFVTQS